MWPHALLQQNYLYLYLLFLQCTHTTVLVVFTVYLSDESDEDTSTCGQFVQGIHWSNYQESEWQKLLDKTGKELLVIY